jgi:hypothetical protein
MDITHGIVSLCDMGPKSKELFSRIAVESISLAIGSLLAGKTGCERLVDLVSRDA